MKRLILGITTATIIIILLLIYSIFVSAVNVQYDFEDGNVPPWQPLYRNADMTVEQEDNGNKYLKISYNGNENRDRNYYDVKVADIFYNDIVQIDYDVMYTEIETEKNGDAQLKYRIGPGKNETQMVARVLKNLGYFRMQDENSKLFNIKGTDGKSLAIEPEHWYSVKIIADLNEGKQTIYIFDRDTHKLLSYSEPVNTIGNNKNINMFTFSSGTDMCVDNVKVYNTSYEDVYIYGNSYVSSATKNKYYLFGKDCNGNLTAIPAGETSWTLETPRSGVSVDSPTGRIIVGSNPEPGPVVIRADRKTQKETITAKYIVYVSK